VYVGVQLKKMETILSDNDDNEAQFKNMEIILSDDDENEVYCEPCNDEDLPCFLERKWLN